MRIAFACVLRSGGDFRTEHVVGLQTGLQEHLSLTIERVCLTDLPDEVREAGWYGRIERLRTDWPGWWSKLELLDPRIFAGYDRVLYADLDTVFVGSLADIVAATAATEGFVMLSDFNRADRPASGVMAWRPSEGTASVYRDYSKRGSEPGNPRRLDFYLAPKLEENGVAVERWQDLVPGQIVSYKRHVRKGRRGGNGKVPPKARIVCYHGVPRPWAEPLPR